MSVFPGVPPNPLGVKVELNLASVWTDITQYVQHRSDLQITNMGRADESSSISACQLALSLKNDGRFTPLLASGAYYPNIKRNTPVRVSVNATSATGQGASLPINANPTFEANVSSWTARNSATIAQSTAQAHTGTGSMSIHGNGTVASPGAESEQDTVIGGHSYTAAAWFFNTASWASGLAIQINWFDSSRNFISNSFASIGSLAANTWTQVTVTGAAPSNAAYGTCFPQISGTPAVGNTFFIDDATLTPVQNYRFHGEISSWPPGSDISGRDNHVDVTASGIWRRISQSNATIGSAFSRYVEQQTGANVPQAYWAMEDGATVPGAAVNFVPLIGANTATATGELSLSADGTSFPGSDALPQFNQARVTANVPAGGTPTNNVVRFALSVPAAGDSQASTFSGGAEVCKILSPSATVQRYDVSLVGNQLQIHGYTSTSGGTAVLSGTVTTKVNGTPVLVSVEITPSGSSINWALRIIKPGAGAVLDQVTGTRATSTIAAVTAVFLDGQGRMADTTGGQLGVWYAVPALTTAASALGGFSGEFAVDRFNRLCAEFGIATQVIGSASAAMGPQADDTLASILQSIEDTDGGLLYESRDQFGLGYRTLGSLQNQAAAVALSCAQPGGVLGAPPTPTYDDQLVRNQVTVTNTDGYTAQATLTSGAISTASPPNGVGVYAGTANTNASSHAQVNAIAQQKMFQGTVDDVRYPTVVMNMASAKAAPLFASVPGLRLGDYFQLTSLPGTLGGSSTSKQLAWGYSETIGHNSWVITFNAIPELPFETTFSPGVYSVGQAPAQGVAQGSAVGSTVAASQIAAAAALPATISARTIGGMTSFISASTPYDWTFAVSGTPADATYFICTEDQALPIAAGDTFSNTSGLGGPFTVTSIDPPSGGNVTVHFTPDASSVMSVGTVQGGKEGDTWVNTSGGNQVNIWHNGAWSPVTWNAASVIQASSITASLIAAGIVIAGIVDATTVQALKYIATGTQGEFLAYAGTPGAGTLASAISGFAGTDPYSNSFAQGIEVKQGGLILDNQGSAPSAVSGASLFYSSVAGRPRYISQAGNDSAIERSTINVSQFTMTTQTTDTIIGAPLNYLANEGNQSSEYEIEIDGIITTATSGTGTPTFTFGLGVDGTVLGAQFTIGGVMLQVLKTFSYTCRFRLAILTTGAGGTAFIASDGALEMQGVNVGSQTNPVPTAPMGANSGGTTKSFDTTSNHTIQPLAHWGTTSGTSGYGATTYRTRITRRM